MDESNRCQYCGKPVGPKAVGDLCPECLMKVGLGSGVGPETGQPKARPAPPAPEEIAKHFTQLEILSLLGQGGMGFVYKAHQKDLERIVALKILPPSVGDDPAFAQRFAGEAKALAKLNHPGIVTIYEFGKTNGLFYFLMEFVDGVNLRQLLANGRISAREALAIVPQICDALQYAHDQGIVHRDIKPENILLDRKGRVKVADFGLAKLIAMGAESGGAGPNVESSASLTEAGKVMGTPQYMAPEQKERPTEVDHRADIYSLGVVFYQMLTGELPGKPIEAPSKKLHLDVRLDEVVLRALEKEPERRYEAASVLKTEVETIAMGAPPMPPQVVPVPQQEASETAKKWRRNKQIWKWVGLTNALWALAILLWFASEKSFLLAPVIILAAVGSTLVTLPLVRSPYVRFFEALFRVTFTSPAAVKILTLSALGFLGFLCFLGQLEGLRWCYGFSGFFGLFGLIGLAFIVEFIARRTKPPEAATKTWPRRIFWLIASAISVPIGLFALTILAAQLALKGLGVGSTVTILAVLLLIILALSLVIRSLLRAFKKTADDQTNPWLRRIVALVGLALIAPIVLFGSSIVVWRCFGESKNTYAGLSPYLMAPKTESVVVSTDKAVVQQRRFSGEGLLIMFGAATNRWDARHLDSLFAVSMEPSWFGKGAYWIIKRAHGPMGYNLWTPTGTLQGEIVFQEGTRTSPDADGFYPIGEFQPQSGPAIPIAVKLEADKPNDLEIRYRVFEADAVLTDRLVPTESRQRSDEREEGLIYSGSPPNAVSQTAEIPLAKVNSLLKNGSPSSRTNVFIDRRRTVMLWPKTADGASYAREGAVGGLGGFIGLRSGRQGRELRVQYTVTHLIPGGPSIRAELLYEGRAPLDRHARTFFIPFTDQTGAARYLIVEFDLAREEHPILTHTNANDSATATEGQKVSPPPVAMFSAYSGRIEGLPVYALTNTLLESRHVVLAEFQIVDERHSVSFMVSQLSYYFTSDQDWGSNASVALSWRVENVEEGQGAWRVIFDGNVAGDTTRLQELRCTNLIAGDKPFMRPPVLLPGARDNPDFGPEIGLDPKGITWTPAQSQRAFFTGAGDWRERDYKWHSLPLFEATDKEGRIVATMRLQLLVCPLQTKINLHLPTPLLRNGDWREDKELKSWLGPRYGTTNSSRTFPLRHILASQMMDELRSVLLDKPGTDKTPTEDNLSLIVTAPPSVLTRAATFIAIQDWPQQVGRGIAPNTYRRDTVENTARAFFYACSIEEDPQIFSQLLSIPILAQLKGVKIREHVGDTIDPKIAKDLRGNWKGRDDAVKKVMNAWNKYPLRHLREKPDVAMAFGLRYFALASFEGAPDDFTVLSFIRDGNGSVTNDLVLDTLPPWFSGARTISNPVGVEIGEKHQQ